MWIPSNKGSSGNECAAETACTAHNATKFPFISQNFMLSTLKEKNLENWNNHFSQNIRHSSLYYFLQNNLSSRPWFTLNNYSDRKFIVTSKIIDNLTTSQNFFQTLLLYVLVTLKTWLMPISILSFSSAHFSHSNKTFFTPHWIQTSLDLML